MTTKPAIYNNFVIYQGATFNEVLTFKNSDGSLVDLTGLNGRMSVRNSYDSTSAIVEMTTENGGIVNGGVDGTMTLQITATDTANLKGRVYVYDFELVSGSVVERYVQGSISVSREVTR